jgi:hypothetical protein
MRLFNNKYGCEKLYWALQADLFDSILAQIRLSLIKINDLFGPIRDSGLISPDQILDAIKDQNTLKSSQLNYRGFLCEFPKEISRHFNISLKL